MQRVNSFRSSVYWDQLLQHKKLFLQDNNKKLNFTLKLDSLNLLIDFSKQLVNQETIKILCNAAKNLLLPDKINDLLKGHYSNATEGKLVGHTLLREPSPTQEIALVLNQIDNFIINLYNKKYKNIICLGIGGSYLGPMMACKALDNYTHDLAKNLNFYFIANCDLNSINNILAKLDPANTIVIVSSKSFTTKETMHNANIVSNWLNDNSKIFAVTCNVNKALEWGINIANIFKFWDFVGGRFSVWSAVGLPIAIKLGVKNFKKFLSGAYELDKHFKHTELSENLPVLMALIGIWNINFMGYKSLAIMPYLDALEDLPYYLQQLEMESNGKNIDLQNNIIDYDTAPIIWGGVGCNGQHSYMQMLHQGTQIVPVDFLVTTEGSRLLLINCMAQSQALMQGTNNYPNNILEKYKYCSGNRPSSIISFPKLTPEVLGALIALYEHKVFVQGIMWNINSFDQWGVEVGKNLANLIDLG